MQLKRRRVIIAGSKDFEDYDFMKQKLDEYFGSEGGELVETIISGHAEGADILGERYAAEKGLPCSIFPADWQKYGRKAGPLRNSQMLDYAYEGFPEVVAFWNGTSSGTYDTIKKARKKGIPCKVYICIPKNDLFRFEVCEVGEPDGSGEWWCIDHAFVEAEREYYAQMEKEGRADDVY